MSNYKFRAIAVNNIDVHGGGRSINVELDMDTPQAKAAFLTLAGDTRLNELGDWMEELGYTIAEIDPNPANEVAA
jgi:hypothetical protein